ncbi:MAG TPA: radical SAM family heme chaperone HemW, partial [Chitinophagaceae bacterium]
KEIYNPVSAAEITLEANPDDLTKEKLEGWKKAGINRLSIGVQSFYQEELQWMNRAHNAQQALESILLAKEYFENITIDLIYGSPLLTDEMWKSNVDKAISLNIPHLSCYALTVEEKTPLHKMIHLNKSPDVDNDKQARQFLLLMQWLRAAGYEHYEVSNFAKPGYRSRHNASYWQGEKYLGLGPSAHSYDGINRQWNIANNQQYISSVQKGILPAEKEILTETDRLNEYLMISLRTIEGIDKNRLKKTWGEEVYSTLIKKIQPYIDNKLVIEYNGHYKLTDEGMLKADGIASDLFNLDLVKQ